MDRYEVIRQVGRGAFGRALMVRHKHGGDPRLYVIKEISLRQLSARDKDASRKEVTLLSKMKHPNIVAFYESFHERNHLYILMEYCDSGDLMNRIQMQRGRPFSEPQIVDWLVQISLGLKHIHDRKVLHRDIKSQNIFLTHGGLKVKLGDFGIARMLNSTMELVRTCVGTPYYLSPEICENKPYNNKTDIWSLGCVLYELCALKHPFEGSNLKQLVLRICRGRYAPLSQRYSTELRLMLNQLLKVSPRDRPSANSLLKRPLLQTQISKHLDTQLLEEEFSHTVLHTHTPAAQKDSRNTDHRSPLVDHVSRDPVRRRPVPNLPVLRSAQRRPAADDPEVKARPAVAFRAPVGPERRMGPVDTTHEREPADQGDLTPAPEPYRLVAVARDEYLQRRREAHQYKLRAEKQLGLRPSTADAEGCQQANTQEHHGNRPSQRRRPGQEEYLQQLQRIREQYHHDVRQMRMRAEVKETAETETPNNRHNRKQQRGITFEIKLTEDQMNTEEEKEPLNNTLTFTQGENIRKQNVGSEVRQEEEDKEMRRAEWCRDITAETLLNALENMNTTDSISDTSVTVSEAQEDGNRKQWTNRLPETLLNALAHVQITDCTAETLLSSEETRPTEEESDGDDDVDEERLEPRSDDEDTNFEESEDELREEVNDSMRNLLTSQELEEEEQRDEEERREEEQREKVEEQEEEQGGCKRFHEEPPHITGTEEDAAEGGAAEGGGTGRRSATP